ncbi:hypothetical protein DFJ73DRAFT_833691 [Zopfochytrium polystomum]|nr:hypothetical protein DFJ73DRAFT_833691 [Zopfochytrium polystomum]
MHSMSRHTPHLSSTIASGAPPRPAPPPAPPPPPPPQTHPSSSSSASLMAMASTNPAASASGSSAPSAAFASASFAPSSSLPLLPSQSSQQQSVGPPAAPATTTTASKGAFDIIRILAAVQNRPNPLFHLGPIDLSSSFLVSERSSADDDLRIIYVSDSFEKLTGYAKKEVIGLNCRFLQAPPPNPVVRGRFREYSDNDVAHMMKHCLTVGEECQFYNVNYKKDASPFMNLITIIPVRTNDGLQADYFVGFQEDVLIGRQNVVFKRKEDGRFVAELEGSIVIKTGITTVNYQSASHQSLKRRRERSSSGSGLHSEVGELLVGGSARTQDSHAAPITTAPSANPSVHRPAEPVFSNHNIVENSPDLIHILSSRGIILYASPTAAVDLLEYEASELVGKNISNFSHPGDFVSMMRELKTSKLGEEVSAMFRFKRKDSGYTWIEINGRRYEMNNTKKTKCYILSGRRRLVGSVSLRPFVESLTPFYRPFDYFGSLEVMGSSVATLGLDDVFKTHQADMAGRSGTGTSALPADLWAKVTREGFILFVSPNSSPIFGLQPSAMYAMSLLDFLYEPDQKRVAGRFIDVLEETHAYPSYGSRGYELDHRDSLLNVTILSSGAPIPAVVVMTPCTPLYSSHPTRNASTSSIHNPQSAVSTNPIGDPASSGVLGLSLDTSTRPATSGPEHRQTLDNPASFLLNQPQSQEPFFAAPHARGRLHKRLHTAPSSSPRRSNPAFLQPMSPRLAQHRSTAPLIPSPLKDSTPSLSFFSSTTPTADHPTFSSPQVSPTDELGPSAGPSTSHPLDTAVVQTATPSQPSRFLFVRVSVDPRTAALRNIPPPMGMGLSLPLPSTDGPVGPSVDPLAGGLPSGPFAGPRASSSDMSSFMTTASEERRPSLHVHGGEFSSSTADAEERSGFSGSGGRLDEVLAKPTSMQFELNQLRLSNRKILDEIQRLKANRIQS